jgi:hypothetical protein
MNLWVTINRSLIPLGLNGVVTDIETRFEKNPGTDDVVLIYVDGEDFHVDPSIARRLEVGDRVSKSPLTTAIETSKGYVRLRPSTDFTRMLIVMPLMLGLIAFGVMRGRLPGPNWNLAVRHSPRADVQRNHNAKN